LLAASKKPLPSDFTTSAILVSAIAGRRRSSRADSAVAIASFFSNAHYFLPELG
jgi:hypothetical protein